MGDVAVSIPAFGFTLRLLPERAVLIEETRTLLIADPHFGKSATFRKGGIPIPDSVLQVDLMRLSNVLRRTEASELLILGDFFHSDVNSEWDTFLQWKESYQELNVKVIPGNHDRTMLGLMRAENLLLAHEVKFGALTLSHEPPKERSRPALCGHIHPSITLRGKGRQNLRFPAFVLLQNTLILPAFGSFTGFEDMSKSGYKNAWITQENKVWSIS